MSTFSEQGRILPPSNVVVPPEAWSPHWGDRPEEDVCIGLRFVADGDLEDARVEAYRRAERLFPDHEKTTAGTELFITSFQDGLVRWVIARGTCDPNNIGKAWEGWEAAPEDIAVEQALTDQGAQLIYDAWERMRIQANIGLPTATDADLLLLPELLKRLPRMATVSHTRALRLRRLLRFVLEELEDVGPEQTPTPDPKAPPGPTSAEETTTTSHHVNPG